MAPASARAARLALGALLLSGLLAACGGGGDDGAATASAPAPTGSGGGGALAAAPTLPPTGSGGGGALTATPTPPPSGADASGGAVSSATRSATLSWTPPTLNDDGTPAKLTGYRIYWGHTKDNPTHSVTVTTPGLSRYVVESLSPATWHFFVTALSAGGESPPSNVITMDLR